MLRGAASSLANCRMNLRDIATGELHEGRAPVVGRVGLDQHAGSGPLCLGQGRVWVGRLGACQLSPVRVWEVAIRHEDGDVAERSMTTLGTMRPKLIAKMIVMAGKPSTDVAPQNSTRRFELPVVST